MIVYLINKLLGWGSNPLVVGWFAGAVALVILLRAKKGTKGRKWGIGCLAFALGWLWIWGTGAMMRVVGCPLERPYLDNGRIGEVGRYPVCDAIVVLGGGVGSCTNLSSYAQLYNAADRVYFAGLLWKAGKAPVVVPSGSNTKDSDMKFLLDLGVPESAIKVENDSKNTEENARFVEELLGSTAENRKKVLLVTSAWHMRRGELMMRKYAPNTDVIAAPCDFEATEGFENADWWELWHPSTDVLEKNSRYWHEWVGYWGYRLLRR